MRESRLSGSVEGVMSNHDPYSDSSESFGLIGASKVYSGLGADIVYGIIKLILSITDKHIRRELIRKRA